MAVSAVKTWVALEALFADDLNAMNTNILNAGVALISPLTGDLDANGQDVTGLDELAFADAGGSPSAAGRLRRNGTDLEWHNGTVAAPLLTGTGGAGSIILVAQIFS